MRRAILAATLLTSVISAAEPPAAPAADAKTRAIAQALMTEGVKQLNARAYDQALANFLEAYAKLPSPRILLDIGSTLRDMGRTADAANTYERYLLDPGAGDTRVGEVRALLAELDARLTLLTVHVVPHDSELSIDGGPFLTVGSTLSTRVRPGIHLVRIRHGQNSAEVTVNGFEGEAKDVTASLPAEVLATPTTPTPVAPTPVAPKLAPKPPERVEAWLSTGTTYRGGDAGGNDRRVHAADTGDDILPILPNYDAYTTSGELIQPVEHVHSGVLAMTRIDGRGRGVAGGLGLALAVSDRLEIELAVLRSEQWGVYGGARYRFLTGALRPYVGAGVPVFAFDDDRAAGDPTKVSWGVRAAAGIEFEINSHFSVQGDLGYERFYHLAGTSFDPSIFVPTVAIVGRL